VSKRKPADSSGQAESFGERLARLRKAAGYTQRELAAEIDISQRMVAYYEVQTDYPPAHLLPVLVDALGVSADELLGIAPTRPGKSKTPANQRLWRRFRQIEKLPAKDRRQLLGLIDTFLERDRLR